MRRLWAICLAAGGNGMASACSGPHVAEAIHRNLAVGTKSLVTLAVLLAFSTFLGLKAKSFFAPLGLLGLIALVWLAQGTAYHGDCGGSAADSGRFGTLFGIAIVLWQWVSSWMLGKRKSIIQGL